MAESYSAANTNSALDQRETHIGTSPVLLFFNGTVPADADDHVVFGTEMYCGGTGGGSTHGSATGAGLVGARGGAGGRGCGGGGGGGALTGSSQGMFGLGGPGQVIIVSW